MSYEKITSLNDPKAKRFAKKNKARTIRRVGKKVAFLSLVNEDKAEKVNLHNPMKGWMD